MQREQDSCGYFYGDDYYKAAPLIFLNEFDTLETLKIFLLARYISMFGMHISIAYQRTVPVLEQMLPFFLSVNLPLECDSPDSLGSG